MTVEIKIHSQTVLMAAQMVVSKVDLTEKKKVGNLVVWFGVFLYRKSIYSFKISPFPRRCLDLFVGNACGFAYHVRKPWEHHDGAEP